MTYRIRKILLYLTILFFILFAPAVLFYAWGYSFDFQTKKPVLTGGFYFKSIPKAAQVELNGKFKGKTPIFIKRLLPKDYQIKISKPGFHNWEKKLKVESKLVTEARKVLLIPLEPIIEIVQENLSEDFSLKEFLEQEKSEHLFYVQETSYILYKTDQNNSFQEQISLSPLPANQTYHVFASKNQRIVVLSNQQKLYLLNPETRTFDLIGQDVQGLQFSDDNKKLLFLTPTEIWVYYLEEILIQPNKKADDKELITRLSQKINQAIWYGLTNEHIIFAVGQAIKIIELDNRDFNISYDLLQRESEISQIAYEPDEEMLYFVEGEKLFKASLK